MFHEDGRRRWTPLLAALGLVILATGIAVGASLVQSPKRSTTANPSPPPGQLTVTPLRVPPANQRLLWFRDDSTGLPFVLRATDWTGHALGQLSLSCSTCGVLPSPDGQRLLIGGQTRPGPAAKSDQVYSAAGRLLSTVDGFQARWSDDGSHLCTVRGSNSDPVKRGAELDVTDVTTGTTRSAAVFTTTQEDGLVADWTLLGCSARNDRAVVAFAHDAVRALRVLQLSTGRVILARDVGAGQQCGCPISSLALSGDGTVAAENLTLAGGVRVLDLVTGQETPVPEAWSGRGPVVGLSWTGRLAITPIGVFTFPTGSALWQAPLPAYLLPVATQPYSDDVLLNLWVSSATAGQVVIVRSNGSSARLPSSGLSQAPPLPF